MRMRLVGWLIGWFVTTLYAGDRDHDGIICISFELYCIGLQGLHALH